MNKISVVTLCMCCSVVMLAGCGKESPTVTDKASDTIVQDTKTNTAKPAQTVSKGDTVSVMYLGTLEDGTVFDTNIVEEAKKSDTYNELRPYEPLTFVVGAGQMIPGFDSGVEEMKLGETKTINIPAAQAYGQARPDMIQSIPLQQFIDAGVDVSVFKKGEKFNFQNLRGVVQDITDETVTIDFNHELAGKDLIFTVTIEDIVAGKDTAPVVPGIE